MTPTTLGQIVLYYPSPDDRNYAVSHNTSPWPAVVVHINSDTVCLKVLSDGHKDLFVANSPETETAAEGCWSAIAPS